MPEHTTESLLTLARGFQQARVLITAAELDLFTCLADGPLAATEVTRRLGGHLRPLTILLDACAALGLLDKSAAGYATPPALRPLLAAGAPASVLPMLLHSGSMWRSWSALTDIVARTGTPERPPIDRRSPEELAAFIGAMHVVSAPAARHIARLVGVGEARALLDIGAGPGTWTLAFLEESPALRATLFDLPPVLELARPRVEDAGQLHRVSFSPGDFRQDPLPGGHDLALLSAIIHSYSLAENERLYRKIKDALVPGGRLIIRDHVMQPDRLRPASGALFAVNMLVATEGGGTFTLAEIAAGLTAAGFTSVRLLQEGERMDGLIEAFRPR